MNEIWAGSCNRCGNDIYMDYNGSNLWCYKCEEEPNIEDEEREDE